MRLLLIVNPSASSITPRSQVLIRREFSRHHDVELVETTRRGHATRLAADAAQRNFDGAVVLGGDGTLNEAANGLVGSDTALIPLPGGSTNVFARTLGFPDDALEASRLAIEALADDRLGRIGLGQVNGRYFLFHAGVGFDAAVVEQVERRSDLKRYLSHPLFIYAAIKTWFGHFDRSEPHFGVDFDSGRSAEVMSFFTIVMNSDPYTYLGSRPLIVAPEATLDRSLSVLSVTSLRADRLLRLAADALGQPGLGPSRSLHHRADVDMVHISSTRAFPYQVDGDFLGRVTDLTFSYAPRALNLLQPELGSSTDRIASG